MRKFVLAGMACVALGAVFTVPGASAQTVTPTAPLRVIAHVKPPHILKQPFRWTTFGQIIPPKLFCAAGVTNPAYCETAPANVCGGTVSIRFSLGPDPYLKKGGKLVGRATATVLANCTFTTTNTIPAKYMKATRHIKNGKSPGRFDGFYTDVTYNGDTYMTPKEANTQITIAKLINHKKTKKKS